MNKEEYIRMRKILSKSIVITIYVTFIGYVLGDIQSIADWNYNVHEMLYAPINIAYFILPVQVLVWIYYAIKSCRAKRDRNTNKVRVYIKNSITVISLVLIVVYFIIQAHGVSTGGVFKINNKTHGGNKYYFMLDKTKVRCTWNEYNLIEEGKSYLIQYEWNTYWPDKGELERIDTTK